MYRLIQYTRKHLSKNVSTFTLPIAKSKWLNKKKKRQNSLRNRLNRRFSWMENEGKTTLNWMCREGKCNRWFECYPWLTEQNGQRVSFSVLLLYSALISERPSASINELMAPEPPKCVCVCVPSSLYALIIQRRRKQSEADLNKLSQIMSKGMKESRGVSNMCVSVHPCAPVYAGLKKTIQKA